MSATLKWVVLPAPMGIRDTTGSEVIADATTIVAVVPLGDGTVVVYYT